jgi:hypothetical protein
MHYILVLELFYQFNLRLDSLALFIGKTVDINNVPSDFGAILLIDALVNNFIGTPAEFLI